MTHTILIVDDEAAQREFTYQLVTRKLAYDAVAVSGGQEAINYILNQQEPKPDLMLLDLSMPQVDGMEVIRAVRAVQPQLPIIILTMHGDVERAVLAIKAGASDFLAKPVPKERLRVSIENALRVNLLSNEIERLQRNISGEVTFNDLIGKSAALKHAVNMAQRAAISGIPVLIEGESGVGKELFARAIHGASERVGKPFVTVNCGAIPENLVESVLFGHEKGAFTGALHRTMGKFREADGGTLFLDEVGELKPELQVKLLRVLQEGEIDPVGGKGKIKVDVRIISATNRHLQKRVESGDFREDLFYRLNVFPITVPPLRDRREDIPMLIEHFYRRFSVLENKTVQGIEPDAADLLLHFPWPGNIRQLENAIFRAVVLADDFMLTARDFQQLSHPSINAGGGSNVTSLMAASPNGSLPLVDVNGNVRRIENIEAEIIRFALRFYQGHMSEVARRLGIGRSTLYRKISDFGIQDEEYSSSSPTIVKPRSAMQATGNK